MKHVLAAAAAAPLRLPALVEAPFSLAHGAAYALTGVIDRVDACAAPAATGADPKPTASSALVREFKSGAPWRREGKLGRTAMGAVQVDLYTAAVASALALDPAHLGVAAAGQVESLETGDVVVPARKRARADGAPATPLDDALLAAARGIAGRHFPPTPSLVKCGFCSVRAACADAAAVTGP